MESECHRVMLVLDRVTHGMCRKTKELEACSRKDKKNLWTSKEHRGVERVKWASCERDGEIYISSRGVEFRLVWGSTTCALERDDAECSDPGPECGVAMTMAAQLPKPALVALLGRLHRPSASLASPSLWRDDEITSPQIGPRDSRRRTRSHRRS